MQVGSLEHALHAIEKRQAELALSLLMTPQVDGRDPSYLLGLYAGQVRGLQIAKAIIDEILNPPDPKESKRNGR